ncbi:MAG: UDP-N-acetylmuramate--L-alanine ligase [Corallococcus sp.]|nr:UDP-N-acetylmuramate--L-alanine ligase [Corallococcus sp.]MCM1359949.1 UDP-N-acetylmuramate--L-alanine ligase [Corallococcus sp.]MCM1395505.1 UDP-N-acetylmuramate--L-alanine ligase [Corallococcus sp.]
MLEKIPHRVHFVGIGGIGMSALAQHLLRLGHAVSGSDRQENEQTAKLRKLGAIVTIGHCENAACGAELVVHTSAVQQDNCELVYARTHGIPAVLREELLGTVFNGFGKRIAVCGTHGKTTVTAMIHHVLERCGVDHAAFIGGEYRGKNYFFGNGVAVAEACEYNRSFLHLRPSLCVCLNVEHDHPDCYADQADTERAFCQLFAQSQCVVLPSKHKSLCKKAVICGEDVAAKNIKINASGCASFDVYCAGEKVGRTELSICGKHNVCNAIAAFAAAHTLGLPALQILQALHTFAGVDRRWTAMHGICDVVCDYAHHPTEIDAALATAKSVAKGRVICIFQPHTYSRTKAFFDRFIDCFTVADEVIYLPVYSAREKPVANVTSFQLYKLAKLKGVNAKYCPNFDNAAQYVRRIAKPDDLVLLVGAGNVNTLADMLK